MTPQGVIKLAFTLMVWPACSSRFVMPGKFVAKGVQYERHTLSDEMFFVIHSTVLSVKFRTF